MFLKQRRFSPLQTVSLVATLSIIATIGKIGIEEAWAQGSPIPGANVPVDSAPQPGLGVPQLGPASGQKKGRYHQLPLTAVEAKQRLDELRVALSVSRPQDVQDGIFEMVEWLQDAADAHYRMSTAFAKSDLTKREAASERQLTSKFGQLKREAMLLKADLLIKQNRAPEALSPLVDIVIADARGATGQAAYKRLQELGFSQELPAEELPAQASK